MEHMTTEQREHLSRAYRDLATAQQNLLHSVEALRAAGWTLTADEQQRTAAMIEEALEEISLFSIRTGGVL